MAPYQQSFEINVGTQNINVGVLGANRQLSSNQHKTIYSQGASAPQPFSSMMFLSGGATSITPNSIKGRSTQ